MAFLDEATQKISKTGQAAGERVKKFMSVNKLTSMIVSEESKIKNLYMQIGKKYHEENQTSPTDEYADLFSQISEAQEHIAEHKKEIKSIKGIIDCPDCGAENAGDTIYCGYCGCKMPEKPKPVEEPPCNCAGCGEKLLQGAGFCPYCGKRSASGDAECVKCGTTVDDSAVFCPKCGDRIVKPVILDIV